jgi:hypothetical protein
VFGDHDVFDDRIRSATTREVRDQVEVRGSKDLAIQFEQEQVKALATENLLEHPDEGGPRDRGVVQVELCVEVRDGLEVISSGAADHGGSVARLRVGARRRARE